MAVDRVVIVGGSLAGASAARSLRRQGFSGEVLLRRSPRPHEAAGSETEGET